MTEKTNKKSETNIRLTAMNKAFDSGKLTSVNAHKDGRKVKRNFENIPNNTIYAHL